MNGTTGSTGSTRSTGPESPFTTDVLVVGSGPTGLLLAA